MRYFSAILALLCVAQPVRGQSVLQNAWHDLKYVGLDIGYVWTAPLHTDKRDLPAIAAVVGAFGLTFAFDEQIQEWVDTHHHTAFIKAFEPFRDEHFLEREGLGDAWFFIRASTALWLVGLAFDSKTLREAGAGCAAAGMAQTFPRRIALYNLVARTRPDTTDNAYEFDVPGSDDWYKRSFYGGHAANAMTCIAYWNHRFDLSYAEPILYAAAVGVAVGRTIDEAHWASDNLLGAIAGYAVGKAVADRTKKRARKAGEREEQDSGGFRLDVKGSSLYAGWEIRF